jgi:hypothetical protein
LVVKRSKSAVKRTAYAFTATAGATAAKAVLWGALGFGLYTSGFAASRAFVGAETSAADKQTQSALVVPRRSAPTPAQPVAIAAGPKAPALGRETPSLGVRGDTSTPRAVSSNRGVVNQQSHGMTNAAGSAIRSFSDELSSNAQALAGSADAASLGVEARGLAAVQQTLRTGRGAEALRLVDEQRQTFARGALSDEREAARILALCAVGRDANARSAAQLRIFCVNHRRRHLELVFERVAQAAEINRFRNGNSGFEQ